MKKRKMKKWLSGMFVAAMALVFAACGNQEEKITVRISNFSGTSVPYNVGMDEGIFEEVLKEAGFDNVEIEITNFANGAAAVEAAQAGELDFITSGDQMLTTAIIENELPYKVIAANYTNSRYAFLATEASGITSPQDLKGKRVGVTIGTNLYMGVLAYLEDNGLSLDDVEVVNLSMADATTAFLSGEIDWGIFSGKNREKLLAEVNPAVLGYNGDYKMNECVIGVSDAFAAEHHDLVVALVKAFDEATKYANENPEEALASAKRNYESDEESLRVNYDDCDFITCLTPEILDSMQRTLDYSYSNGLISHEATVDDVVNLTYLEEAGLQ